MDVAPVSGADVCANSGLGLTERESHPSTMGHASVPFRHASGDAAYSPMCVGVWSFLHIAGERDLSPMGVGVWCILHIASERDLF